VAIGAAIEVAILQGATATVRVVVEATAAPVEPAILEPVAFEAPAAEPVAAEPAPSLRPTDAPADLQVPRTDEPLPALPARYGIDRVVMLAAESEWVFVYWETAPARLGRTNRSATPRGPWTTSVGGWTRPASPGSATSIARARPWWSAATWGR
jgi:hypothetical protein